MGWPWLLVWLGNVSVVVATDPGSRTDLLIPLLALYLSVAFFAFFYALLFMAGSRWRRLAIGALTVGLQTALVAWHLDQAAPHLQPGPFGLTQTGLSTEHLAAAALNGVQIALLTVHTLWLGFGSRPRLVTDAPSVFAEPEEAPSPGTDDLPASEANHSPAAPGTSDGTPPADGN